jgi:hypothetical protein
MAQAANAHRGSDGDAERDLYSDLVEDGGANGETLVRAHNAALRERMKMHDEEMRALKRQVQDVQEANERLRG